MISDKASHAISSCMKHNSQARILCVIHAVGKISQDTQPSFNKTLNKKSTLLFQMHSDNYGMRSNENKIEILITRYTENKDLRQKLEDKK